MGNDFSIGIIGGTGGIGKWFADFFVREGYSVYVTGRKRGLPLAELATLCRVLVVAVPIADTIDVIEKVGPHLPADSLLMDLTSLKEEPVKAMLGATSAEVVGCHPLFGSDVVSIRNNNIILCPARGDVWLSFLKGLFVESGARVTMSSPGEHDRMMSLTQGLTHFNTILMELAIRDSGKEPSELEPFSTPIFRVKRSLSARVFGPSADLYAAILTKNPHVMEVVERYEKNFFLLKKCIADGDTAGLVKLLKSKNHPNKTAP
jgi:prephenate dehydrogenase